MFFIYVFLLYMTTNITKTTCINEVNKKTRLFIHPLLNTPITLTEFDNEKCIVIPQIKNNEPKVFFKKSDISNNAKKLHSVAQDNPILNFSLPINKYNFLEIVYNITNIKQLDDFVTNYSEQNNKLIKVIMDLFWETKIDEIINNIDLFININQKMFKNIFNTNYSYNQLQLIIIKLTKKYNNKKIKYIPKVKKYLTTNI